MCYNFSRFLSDGVQAVELEDGTTAYLSNSGVFSAADNSLSDHQEAPPASLDLGQPAAGGTVTLTSDLQGQGEKCDQSESREKTAGGVPPRDGADGKERLVSEMLGLGVGGYCVPTPVFVIF